MITIRRAFSDDFPAVNALLEQLMHAQESPRRTVWAAALADPGYVAWMAQVNSTPAGFLDLIVFPDPAHGNRIGMISNLVVDEHFRARGVGDQLVATVVAHCREYGVAELHVWTDSDNAAAVGLYKKRGFIHRGLLLELGIKP